MRTVAESYQGRDPATASHSAHLGPNLSQPLINVAEAIVNLRQARHEADYNHAQQFHTDGTHSMPTTWQSKPFPIGRSFGDVFTRMCFWDVCLRISPCGCDRETR